MRVEEQTLVETSLHQFRRLATSATFHLANTFVNLQTRQ
jgi:hypothetical protein